MKLNATFATALAALTFGTGVVGLGAYTINAQNVRNAEIAEFNAQILADGAATFQHTTDETAKEFTYTAEDRGIETVWVTYNDGVKVWYNFGNIDADTGNLTIRVEGQEAADATYRFFGTTIEITAENNVTKLGNFKQYLRALTNRRNQEAAAHEAQRTAEAARNEAIAARNEELNEETFTAMISRMSKDACVVLEGADFINGFSVTNSIQSVIDNGFEMGSNNQARWNNMNGQLRREHVTGAMNYDCNNAMMVSAQNNLAGAAALWSF